jgi:hypothetical protein
MIPVSFNVNVAAEGIHFAAFSDYDKEVLKPRFVLGKYFIVRIMQLLQDFLV